MNKYLDANFKTPDLTLATTLSLFFPIKAVDRSNPPKASFIFDRSEDLENFVEKFWRKEILVEPQSFANQVKNLKTRIYSGE